MSRTASRGKDTRQRRIAIIVQRYGLEVNGGAELYARWLAERLQELGEVHVITTCALDYTTWDNHYPPGESELNGVIVHRFPVDVTRNWHQAQKQTGQLLLREHSFAEEVKWVKDQGPYSSSLLTFLKQIHSTFDAFLFVTYQYATTVFGLPLVADKAVLAPTAHDDPFLSMPVFQPLFNLPKALVYLTKPEMDLVHRVTQNQARPHVVAGVGVEVPQYVSGERFRNKYGIKGPFVLYTGRINEAKNVPELLDYYQRFRSERTDPPKLVLMGSSHLKLPQDNDVLYLGFVSDEDKADGLAAAAVVIMPSLYESLSIVILEAWLLGVPVLVNGHCEVLKYQCRQSGGGLYYVSYDEFNKTLSLLLESPSLRQRMGQQAKAFVAENYRWDIVMARLTALFESVLWSKP